MTKPNTKYVVIEIEVSLSSLKATMSVVVWSCYLINITIDIVLIFLISITVIEFDEIKTSKKNPVAQCNLLNPLVMIFTIEGGIVNGCLMVLML